MGLPIGWKGSVVDAALERNLEIIAVRRWEMVARE
jgi:hypothetical protein